MAPGYPTAGETPASDSSRSTQDSAVFVSEDIRLFYRDAAAYDAAYEGGGDLSFWAEACRRYQPKSVLELAVGTGRVAVPLARQGVEQGFAVTGVDVTPEMVTFAQGRLAVEPPAVQANLTLAEGDIRDFDLGQQFDLVFIAPNTILHLSSLEDRLGAFRCAYQRVSPGGRFIVDIFNTSVLVLANVQEASARRDVDRDVTESLLGQRFVRAVSRRYDKATQTIRSRLFLEKYRNKRPREKRMQDLTLHMYFPEELRLLMLFCGFSIDAVYGDYSWGASPRIAPR